LNVKPFNTNLVWGGDRHKKATSYLNWPWSALKAAILLESLLHYQQVFRV
jgi:hypothetical protein